MVQPFPSCDYELRFDCYAKRTMHSFGGLAGVFKLHPVMGKLRNNYVLEEIFFLLIAFESKPFPIAHISWPTPAAISGDHSCLFVRA